MAGLGKNTPVPTEIGLHQQSRFMEIHFADGAHFSLPYEYLRVFSPSAEVRGHMPGQEVLQSGKRSIEITSIEAVGNYAVKQESYWQSYLIRLEAAGANRDVDSTTLPPKTGGGCGKH